MSGLPEIADIGRTSAQVRVVPIADIASTDLRPPTAGETGSQAACKSKSATRSGASSIAM